MLLLSPQVRASPSTRAGGLAVSLPAGQQIPVAEQRQVPHLAVLTATAAALLQLCDHLVNTAFDRSFLPNSNLAAVAQVLPLPVNIFHWESVKTPADKEENSHWSTQYSLLSVHLPEVWLLWHYPSSEYDNYRRCSPKGQRLALSDFVCTQKLVLLNSCGSFCS